MNNNIWKQIYLYLHETGQILNERVACCPSFFVLNNYKSVLFWSSVSSVSWDYRRNSKWPLILKPYSFCSKKFYGEIQFFQLRIFNWNYLLIEVTSRFMYQRQGKNASNSCGAKSIFFSSVLILQIPNIVCLTILDF